MRFYRQGPHDGLCGFIAVLNAFRILEHGPDHQFACDNDHEFFDEAVEALARVPGVDIRILRGNPAVGGIDQFQVRDLAIVLAERVAFPVAVTLINTNAKMPFASRYRKLHATTDNFALVVPYRDHSHWITAAPKDRTFFYLIDEGESYTIALRGGDGPKLANDVAIVLTTVSLGAG
jgi:hypothetical protein